MKKGRFDIKKYPSEQERIENGALRMNHVFVRDYNNLVINPGSFVLFLSHLSNLFSANQIIFK